MTIQRVGPLNEIRVVDFTTLAPGPLASLMLLRAGAEVIKVERPGIGDEMRIYDKAFGDNGATFAMLNAGKRSLSADLRDTNDLQRVKDEIIKSDVVLEQFRPNVLKKFGLDYESLYTEHPRLIYCSITGFGQYGPKSQVAAHDLNYVADTGMLSLGECPDGKPAIPPLLAADLAAGSYPAVMNIALALLKRSRTGEGCYIDVSMTDNLFPLMFWSLALGWGAEKWSAYGGELLSGGSPRYQVYRTSDERFLAVAALEQRFWVNFCETVGLDHEQLDEEGDTASVIEQVAEIVAQHTADHWRAAFAEVDACVLVVNTLQEAVQSPHYQARGMFEREICNQMGDILKALPLPIVNELSQSTTTPPVVPELGEFNT